MAAVGACVTRTVSSWMLAVRAYVPLAQGSGTTAIRQVIARFW